MPSWRLTNLERWRGEDSYGRGQVCGPVRFGPSVYGACANFAELIQPVHLAVMAAGRARRCSGHGVLWAVNRRTAAPQKVLGGSAFNA